MNLHGIVRGAITTVNPDIPALLQRSNGYTTQSDGEQIPQYIFMTGSIQVQGVSGKDLEHVNMLNIQGVLRKVYMYGDWSGVVRGDSRGGDLLQFADTSTASGLVSFDGTQLATFDGALLVDPGTAPYWKVVTVAETWPDWCSVIVSRQAQ